MIKDMKEIYEEDRWGWYDYTPMIKSFAEKVLVQVEDDDYQGDTRVLLQDNNRIGHLIFGWGSCSGCDALQGCCGNYDELNELANDLYNDIKWFDTVQEALDYFNNHDWEGDYCWHIDETREYINKCKEILNEMLGEM